MRELLLKLLRLKLTAEEENDVIDYCGIFANFTLHLMQKPSLNDDAAANYLHVFRCTTKCNYLLSTADVAVTALGVVRNDPLFDLSLKLLPQDVDAVVARLFRLVNACQRGWLVSSTITIGRVNVSSHIALVSTSSGHFVCLSLHFHFKRHF